VSDELIALSGVRKLDIGVFTNIECPFRFLLFCATMLSLSLSLSLCLSRAIELPYRLIVLLGKRD
jgi:hypothetical protein